MEQAIEFSTHHWPLVVSFIVLLALALYLELNRSGASVIGIHELTTKVNQEEAKLVDIRDSKEFKAGHIVDAINVPLAKFDSEIKNLLKYKDKPVIVICQTGQQAAQAVTKLQASGFEKAYRLSGGIAGWRNEKLPLVKS